MKALITGAGGQVGRALTASAPDDVDVISATHSDLDISDRDLVGEFVASHRPELIINAAAYTAVDLAESNQEAANATNAEGARHLAAAAGLNGARLLQLSTDFVFDGTSPKPYRPDAKPHPLGVYGSTKLAGEKAVLEELPESGIILRTAWVYSPTGQNFVLTMLRLMSSGTQVRVVADQIGSPTAAASIATAVWALAGLPELQGIFHWTDAGVASWYDFAVAIAEEAACAGILREPAVVHPITTAHYPTPAARPPFSVLDSRATISATGVSPPHWRTSLRNTLREIADA